MNADVLPLPRRLTRAQSKARTRQQLLNAAAELLAQRGVSATSVEEIAEAAGYSIGAIYSNFGSKEELVLALLDERLTIGAKELVRRFDEGSDDPQIQADIAEGYFDEIAQEHQAWFLLILELWLYAIRHPAFRPRVAQVQSICRDRIEALIARRFTSRNLQPPMPAADIARMVMALVDGLVQQHLIEPETQTRDAFRNALRWLLAGALADTHQSSHS